MAINVLQYNQLIRKVNVKNEQIEAQRRLRDSADSACGNIPAQIQSIIDSINNYDSAIDSAQDYISNFGSDLTLLGLMECNFAFYSMDISCVCAWQHIRNVCDLTGYTSVGCLCMDGASTNCCIGQCGFYCGYTVPSGTNRLQVELWGPGASTTWESCCSFGPNGATGAYYSNVFCVNPGDTFCFYSGCAICCFAKSCEGGYPASNMGAPSFMYGCTSATGSNVCICLCVMGGRANLAEESAERGGCCGSNEQYSCCQGYWGSGNCICRNGYTMCFESSRGSRAYEGHAGQGGYCQCTIPYKLSRCSLVYEGISGGAMSDVTVPAMCFMVPSIHNKGFFSNDNYGNMCSAGTPKFPCIQCYCFTSETCWGGKSCQNCQGHRQLPGGGGMGTHAMGGGTAWCGDTGRSGAVYLRWGCI
jgi:hypothetical protein